MNNPTIVHPAVICENLVKEALKKDHVPTAVNTLRTATKTVLDRIKNNLDVSVKEKSSVIQEKFCKQIGEQLQAVCNSWIDISTNQFVVVPEGTRFVHRDGSLTTIIVEQKPCVRQITYGTSETFSNYAISLPFIQFYCSFDNNRFHGLSVTSSKKPLASLTDVLNPIPMPNCSSTSVCCGNMSEVFSRWTENTPISKKVAEVIAAYWGSQFNNDLSSNLIQFFSDNFNDVYKSCESGGGSNYRKCFKEWAKKSEENPMFAISDECKTRLLSVPVLNLLPSSMRGGSGRLAVQNNIRNIIDSGIKDFVQEMTAGLLRTNFEDDNRNQAHLQSLADNIRQIVGPTYNTLWTTIHSDHQRKVYEDNEQLDIKKQEVETLVANSADIIESVETAKSFLKIEKQRIISDLHRVHLHLESELQKVQEMKAQLSMHFGEDGKPLPAKRRGRPKKEPLPDNVQLSMARVADHRLMVGEDGLPLIQRKRGRPRKNPV